MLVLTRKLNQEIRISDDIVVRVIGIRGNQVRLGIVAPDHVSILREEIQASMPSIPQRHGLHSRVMKCARC